MDATSMVWTGLPGYVNDAGSMHDVIAQVIDVCEAARPHEDWERLRALAWDDGAERVARWLQELLRDEPPGPEVRGLWFGLNNPIDASGRTRADLAFSGTSEYDPDDEELEWVFSAIHHPERQPAPDCLAEMYRIAYDDDGGLGNDAEWPLALVFGCVAVARALQALDATSTGWRPAAPAGAVCGFDGGDFIFVGELAADGFRADPRVP
jgi:hypothetical protein